MKTEQETPPFRQCFVPLAWRKTKEEEQGQVVVHLDAKALMVTEERIANRTEKNEARDGNRDLKSETVIRRAHCYFPKLAQREHIQQLRQTYDPLHL